MFDDVDQRAGDDCTRRIFANLTHVIGAADAKPDYQRQVGLPTHPFQEGRQPAPQLASCAGDAGERHAVDEPAGERGNASNTFIRGRRSNEEDQVESVFAAGGVTLLRFFRRQVGDDQSIRASGAMSRARRSRPYCKNGL